MTHLALLTFLICGTPDPALETEWCEPGEIRAASCQAAEAYLRAGLRRGQELHVMGCEE